MLWARVRESFALWVTAVFVLFGSLPMRQAAFEMLGDRYGKFSSFQRRDE